MDAADTPQAREGRQDKAQVTARLAEARGESAAPLIPHEMEYDFGGERGGACRDGSTRKRR